MAKQGIDPAFQAAPFLGESSHDPIEFTRRHNLAKYQALKQKQQEIQKNTAEGLKSLMLDLKGWEDQEGFKEIMADNDKVINGFLELSKKGMNLTAPKTTDEIMAFKAINDAHQVIKQKVDTWNEQKGLYDLYQKAIEADSAKKESEQRIDTDASYAKIREVLKTKSIMERKGKLENLLVTKPEIGDVHKYVADNLEFITKPDIVTEAYTDPTTGLPGSRSREVMSPDNEKKREQDLRKLFQTAPEPVLNAIKQAKAKDKTLDVMKDEDYFVSMYDPQFKQKYIDKISGTGGGGIDFNFLNTKAKIVPGELKLNENIIGGRNYNQRYDFGFPTQKLFKVPTNGGFQHDSDPDPAKGTDGWSPITGGDYVEAELLFYDPKSDQIIFRSGQTAQNPWVQNNTTFAVPRKNVPDAEKLPIMINGKKGVLKDILPKEDISTTKKLPLPDNFWSKPATPYIPKTKK